MDKKLDTVLLGERLRERRKEAALTVPQVAEAIGKSDKLIEKWEHGDRIPKTEELFALSDLYGGATDYYLGKTDHPEFTPGASATAQYLGLTIPEVTELRRSLRDDKEILEMILGENGLLRNILQAIHATREELKKNVIDQDGFSEETNYAASFATWKLANNIVNCLSSITGTKAIEDLKSEEKIRIELEKLEQDGLDFMLEEYNNGEHQED